MHEPEHDAGGDRAAGHADLLAQHAEHEAAEEQLLGERRDEREQHAVADQRRQRLLLAQVARELLLVGLADGGDVDRGQDPERDERQRRPPDRAARTRSAAARTMRA